MNDVKISVIVPVYNSEQKLNRCIDSVLTQDFEDFEFILIDDGSTDGSTSICDEYAAYDKRIKVIHKENGGVSSARNIGLNHALGDWIVFIDSDDSFKKDHLSKMLKAAEQDSCIDMVFGGFYDVHDGHIEEHSYLKHTYRGKAEIKDFLCETDVMEYMIPWDKMFRRSIIQDYNLYFNTDLSISEDRLFVYQYMMHIQGLATIPEMTYIHDCLDATSLSNRTYPYNMLSCRYQYLNEAMKDLLRCYSIMGDEAYPLVRYDWAIFKSAILKASSETSNIIGAVHKQKKLYTHSFDNMMLAPESPRCNSLLSTREDLYIANGNFLLLNLYIRLRRIIAIK